MVYDVVDGVELALSLVGLQPLFDGVDHGEISALGESLLDGGLEQSIGESLWKQPTQVTEPEADLADLEVIKAGQDLDQFIEPEAPALVALVIDKLVNELREDTLAPVLIRLQSVGNRPVGMRNINITYFKGGGVKLIS